MLVYIDLFLFLGFEAQWSVYVSSNKEKDNVKNIFVKFSWDWPCSLWGDIIWEKHLRKSFFSSGDHFVQQSKTIRAILIEGFITSTTKKFGEIWKMTSKYRRRYCLNLFSIFNFCTTLCATEQNGLRNFRTGHFF